MGRRVKLRNTKMSLPKTLKEELREGKKAELSKRELEKVGEVAERVIDEVKVGIEVELSTKKIKKNGK